MKRIIKNYTNSSILMNSIPFGQIQNTILHPVATSIWIHFHLNSQWWVKVTANTHLPVTFKQYPGVIKERQTTKNNVRDGDVF